MVTPQNIEKVAKLLSAFVPEEEARRVCSAAAEFFTRQNMYLVQLQHLNAHLCSQNPEAAFDPEGRCLILASIDAARARDNLTSRTQHGPQHSP